MNPILFRTLQDEPGNESTIRGIVRNAIQTGILIEKRLQQYEIVRKEMRELRKWQII